MMGFFTIKLKSAVFYLAIFICAVTLTGVLVSSDSIMTAGKERILPIYNVLRADKKAAISFDAAWGNEDTELLIKILEEYNVKTTFFVVGQWVDKYPESVKQLYDAGHEIMNHSNTHPHYTKMTAEKIKEEALICDEKIQKITGVKPFLTRVPYGDYDNKVVTALKEIGHYTIQWDVDSLDWKNPSPDEIVKRVTDKVTDGSIVLFHNAAMNTPKALPQILKNLQDKGFEIIPISEIIYKDNYTIDHKGTQIPD